MNNEPLIEEMFLEMDLNFAERQQFQGLIASYDSEILPIAWKNLNKSVNINKAKFNLHHLGNHLKWAKEKYDKGKTTHKSEKQTEQENEFLDKKEKMKERDQKRLETEERVFRKRELAYRALDLEAKKTMCHGFIQDIIKNPVKQMCWQKTLQSTEGNVNQALVYACLPYLGKIPPAQIELLAKQRVEHNEDHDLTEFFYETVEKEIKRFENKKGAK